METGFVLTRDAGKVRMITGRGLTASITVVGLLLVLGIGAALFFKGRNPVQEQDLQGRHDVLKAGPASGSSSSF